MRRLRGVTVWTSLTVLALSASVHGDAAGDVPKGEERGAAAAGWDFDDDQPGKVPAGWSIRQTNPSQAMATWEVAADPSAAGKGNVLALIRSENYGHTFNLAMAEKSSFADLDLTVRVKAVAGEEDQGGGPIWRCSDENNYYICRFNPLESNYRVYFVKDGRRKQLQSVKVETQAGQWYTVRVTMAGNRITCYLDGEKMLEAEDDTFKEAGMVGLWTKADAVTSFDQLEVRELPAASAPSGEQRPNPGDSHSEAGDSDHGYDRGGQSGGHGQQ